MNSRSVGQLSVLRADGADATFAYTGLMKRHPIPPTTKAVYYLLLTATLWSTSGVLIKLIDWQPLSILAGRATIALIVFLLYLRRVELHPSRAQILGAVAFVGTQVLYITSIKMTSAANAIFLQYTAPVYVVPLGVWLLHERPRRADWVSMGVILVGMLFFFGEKLSLDGLVGNILALLSGATMALVTVATRLASRETGDSQSTAQVMLGAHMLGALIGAPSMLRESFTPISIGIIVFLGVFQIGLATVFYAAGLKHVEALESTIILTLEPILNPIWVFLAIGETPGPLALVGGSLVIGAVLGRAVVSGRAARRAVPEPVL